MIRYVVSAFAAILTLFVTFYGLSKAIAPGTSGALAIIGHLGLFSPSQSEAPEEDPWCSKEPNRILQLAESFRGLCGVAEDDCGPDCVRAPTSVWSADCSSRSPIEVCVPRNPLLRSNEPSG